MCSSSSSWKRCQPQHTVLVNHRSTSPHCAFGTFTITPLPSTTAQSLSITGPPHHTAHLAHLQSLLFHQPQYTVLVNYRSTSPHCASGTFTITPLQPTTICSPWQLQVHLTTLHIWHTTFTVIPLSSTTIHNAPCHSMHLAEHIHNHYSKASVLYSEILHLS